MIHSARPTISPVANIVFALSCLARFWKVGTDWRTDDMCNNNDPTGSNRGPAEWIKRISEFLQQNLSAGG